jgi:LysR family carnitine catabolism transcriptional activator
MKSLAQVNLNSLLHFHSAAKHRSLRAAARELGLSAPAITHSINKLELQFGVTLCIREKGAFQLTERGRSLYERACTTFDSLRAFAEERQTSDTYEGLLSIVMIDHFENSTFKTALNSVLKKFPKMKLSLQVSDSNSIQNLVRQGDLDFGFGIFDERLAALRYFKVGEEKLQYFVSDRHPLWKKVSVTKLDLHGQNVTWVDTQMRNRTNLELQIFSDHKGYKMNVAAYSNNLEAALKILLSGYSVVPLPPSYIQSLRLRNVRRLDVETRAPMIIEECVLSSRAERSIVAAEFLRSLTHHIERSGD